MGIIHGGSRELWIRKGPGTAEKYSASRLSLDTSISVLIRHRNHFHCKAFEIRANRILTLGSKIALLRN